MEAPEPKPPRPTPSPIAAARSVFAAAKLETDETALPRVIAKVAVYYPDTQFWRMHTGGLPGYGARRLVEHIQGVGAQAAVETELFGPPAAEA